MEHQQQATDEGREGAQTEVKEEEGRPTSRIALDAITKAEEFLTSYEVMLGGQGDGAPAMVSAPQAQNTLHSAQQALEPFLACVRASPAPPSSDAASMPLAEDVLSRIKAALFRAYEQEASLLRQLAKVEQSVKNRFLFLHQSSVVSEKALEYLLPLWFSSSLVIVFFGCGGTVLAGCMQTTCRSSICLP